MKFYTKELNVMVMFVCRFKYRISIHLFLLISFSCTTHKESINPCLGITRTIASFKVEEIITQGLEESLWDYESDTICTGLARFTVTSDVDSVIWRIGGGVYYNKVQEINFGKIDKTVVPIELIVFRKPRTDCFPDDKSSDTITKMIYVAPSASRIFGKFNGSWQESPKDTFSIDVRPNPDTHAPFSCVYQLLNLNNTTCSACASGTIGYRKARIQNTDGGCDYSGVGLIDIFIQPDGLTTSMKYTSGKLAPHPSHVFVGIKLF